METANQNLRRYDLTDKDGNTITSFEFELYGTVKWFAKNHGNLKAIILRFTRKMRRINPDGSGATWLDEKRIRQAESLIRVLFSDCPGNVEEAFFSERRPFASVGGEFYLSKVLTIIYNILSAETGNGGNENGWGYEADRG